MARFIIEVSAAELEVVSLAIGRMPNAKPVVDRKASTSSTPPIFATGDDFLDAFMARSWKPSDRVAAAKRAAVGLVKSAPLKPTRWTKRDIALLELFNAAAVKAWRRLGYTVEVSGSGRIVGDGSNVTVTR